MQSKICGVKDSETLNFLINYKYPPELIGFICNYPKSKRFVDINSLKKILKVDNKKSQFVSVLVKPDEFILDEMQKLNFNYFQIYDCTPDEIKSIKKKYNKKIISAINVETKEDILKYQKKLTEVFIKGIDISMKDVVSNREFLRALRENSEHNISKLN